MKTHLDFTPSTQIPTTSKPHRSQFLSQCHHWGWGICHSLSAAAQGGWIDPGGIPAASPLLILEMDDFPQGMQEDTEAAAPRKVT